MRSHSRHCQVPRQWTPVCFGDGNNVLIQKYLVSHGGRQWLQGDCASFVFCFHLLLKVTCGRKSSEVAMGPWSQVGAQPRGAKPVSDNRFLISAVRLKEGKCLILHMLSKKPFSSLCVCPAEAKCHVQIHGCCLIITASLTAAGQTTQRQSSWEAHAFAPPPAWDEGPHFRALSCKARSCPSHWVSSSPWASPLPLWAACGDDG